MAFCTSCGHDLEDASFCTNCGAASTGSIPVAAVPPEANQIDDSVLTTGTSDISVSRPEKNNRKKLILWLSLSAVVILFITAIATARHWEKTDVPEHAETFHSETYLTGNYDIIDDHVSPCYVLQSWVGCTNLYVDEFNASCASFPLTDAASNFCDSYRAMIEDMQSQSWSYMASLGTAGHLTAVAEEATESVSNNDYRAAITHKAVCYLGFLGECK